VVQEAFWSSKVAGAAEALPSDELRSSQDALRDRIATLQQEANQLNAETLYAQGLQARELQAELKRKQGSLDEATNELTEVQRSVREAMLAAQTALFDQDRKGEPLLGAWLPERSSSGSAPRSPIVNVPNAAYPGPIPNFDRAVFRTFASREAAEGALAAGQINVILDADRGNIDVSPNFLLSPTRSMRFILFNLDADGVNDAAIRRALTCMIDQGALAASLPGGGVPRATFVPPEDEYWSDAEAALPCAGLDAAPRLVQAARLLRDAGYTWEQEPITTAGGQGLKRPDGSPVPSMQLLAPGTDEARMAAATYVVQQAQLLGAPIRVNPVTADAIDYAVLSSGAFDMAIIGWKVSSYPGYLCDWFGASGPFHYDPTALTSQCGQLAVTSDLAAARGLMREIQRTLVDEVPLVPLYADVVREPLRGVIYPFTAVLGGLADVYGAPALASPAGP
jgi:ABC-type transport system substrate-binding protein